MLSHYLSNRTTKEFLSALDVDAGIPASILFQGKKGGNRREQGTWVHPDVAINLGQWCSPKLAVAPRCSNARHTSYEILATSVDV